MVTSDISPEVEIRPVRASAMHPAIIIGTVRSLWTWLWGRYHVPQNVCLVTVIFTSLCVLHSRIAVHRTAHAFGRQDKHLGFVAYMTWHR